MKKVDRVWLLCVYCGKQYVVYPIQAATRKFCSKACSRNTKAYTGKGYRSQVDKNNNWKRAHVVKAEDTLGHSLPKGAQVHHADGGFDGSLIICQDQAYHSLLHYRARAYTSSGDAHNKYCPLCKTWDDPKKMVSYPSNPTRFVHKDCVRRVSLEYYYTHPELKEANNQRAKKWYRDKKCKNEALRLKETRPGKG